MPPCEKSIKVFAVDEKFIIYIFVNVVLEKGHILPIAFNVILLFLLKNDCFRVVFITEFVSLSKWPCSTKDSSSNGVTVTIQDLCKTISYGKKN